MFTIKYMYVSGTKLKFRLVVHVTQKIGIPIDYIAVSVLDYIAFILFHLGITTV